MKFFVCPNTFKQEQKEIAKQVIEVLEKTCGKCFMEASKCKDIYNNNLRIGNPIDCDYIVAIGGDGSILRAVPLALKYNKPLFGINGGHLGFLTAISLNELKDFNKCIIEKLKPSTRKLLCFNYKNQEHIALNDIVITKSDYGTSVTLDATIGDDIHEEWHGDGLIVSTPTGSTSYNYSAGGSILMNKVKANIITPICPHGRNGHSIVVDDNDAINITPVIKENNKILIYADGKLIAEMTDPISIKTYNKTLTLLVK